MRFLIMNGPNLGHLGVRQPEIYGNSGMDSLVPLVESLIKIPVELVYFQSNFEGALIDRLEQAYLARHAASQNAVQNASQNVSQNVPQDAPQMGPTVHPPDFAAGHFLPDNPAIPVDGVVLNAGALTHTSLALGDCLAWVKIPCVEVHLSNVSARAATENPVRRQTFLAPHCIGVISGFGITSYALGVQALLQYYKQY